MKTLILKELRENIKLAVLGLGILTLILILNALDYSTSLTYLGGISDSRQLYISWQPLVSQGFLTIAGFFCAIFGAVLGWFQIHNESHRDLWAFLIHRPVTRTEIFLAKITAGLMLYVLGTGLPLAGYIAWSLVPGHVAAPFEWPMLWPAAVLVLTGSVYYFAGMLTGLRQARWYASRALGLVTAIIVSLAVRDQPHLWQALAFILICAVVLATAVWGGFHSHGFYRGQPAAGKLALTGAMAMGCLAVLVLAAFLLTALLLRNSYPWSHYQMTKDGMIYKVTQENGRMPVITKLDGQPLLEAKTGRMPDLGDFNRQAASQMSIKPNFSGHTSDRRWFERNCSRFTFWRATPDTLWYFWDRYGRLVGYEIATRRFIGSLGPHGFSQTLSGDGDRFDDSRNNYYATASRRIINTAHTVYELDLEHRATKAIFNITNECDGATTLAAAMNASDETIGGIGEASLNSYDWDYTIVVSQCYIRLLTPEGKVVWRTSYKPVYPDYNEIQVTFLEPTNQFAIWLSPSRRAQEKAKGKLPTQLTWLDREQGTLRSTNLANLSSGLPQFNSEEKVISLSVPPALMVAVPLFDGEPWPATIPWVLVRYSLAAALVCIPIGWWLGRRYSLSVPELLGWAAFHLAGGGPALLAFLCVQEWPVREPCPNCNKSRTVDREHCEHCGADFAPPEKNGTEVFETLVAAIEPRKME